MPVGYLLGGILADRFFEPVMLSGKIIPQLLGPLVRSRDRIGMAVIFLFTRILGAATCLLSIHSKDLHNLEITLPEHVVFPSEV